MSNPSPYVSAEAIAALLAHKPSDPIRTVIYESSSGTDDASAVYSLVTPGYQAGSQYQFGAENGHIGVSMLIAFQRGNPAEVGPNGWTNEALLAVLIHRTELLNAQFPCGENLGAISCMKDALAFFNDRAKDRQEHGVEGKQEA